MTRHFNRTLVPSLCALSASLFLVACGADDPAVDDENNAFSSIEEDQYGDGSPNNTSMQESPRNNTATNNISANNVASNNTSPNNTTAINNDGAPPEPEPAEEDPSYQDGETYAEVIENDFIDAATENTSTFSIDVDNASYTLMRRDITRGKLPAPAGVRPEEYINFFDYAYPEPVEDQAFSINLEVAPSEFGEDKHLVRIGVKGKDVSPETMKHNNLVFLIDVSGSMQSNSKLSLVKASLAELLDNLRPDDTVGIVVYAGRDAVLLESTEISNRQQIQAAIDSLSAGGSTNGEAGIVTAYEMAERHKVEGANNRVIILTDGDFNVGKTGSALIDYIATQRERHISITCMGYGLGNFNDYHMENIAKEGNGNYYYVDTIAEAERVFGTDLPSTLEVIAADVKIQVEFNNEAVTRYRLMGYDNRVLNNEDFENDAVDAGEIGPGHTVTAYYELELTPDAAAEALLAEVRVRHKSQYGEASTEFSRGIKMNQIQTSFDAASSDFQFAAAVLEYAEVLRGSKHSDGARFDDILTILGNHSDASQPKRSELISLVEGARMLWPSN